MAACRTPQPDVWPLQSNTAPPTDAARSDLVSIISRCQIQHRRKSTRQVFEKEGDGAVSGFFAVIVVYCPDVKGVTRRDSLPRKCLLFQRNTLQERQHYKFIYQQLNVSLSQGPLVYSRFHEGLMCSILIKHQSLCVHWMPLIVGP